MKIIFRIIITIGITSGIIVFIFGRFNPFALQNGEKILLLLFYLGAVIFVEIIAFIFLNNDTEEGRNYKIDEISNIAKEVNEREGEKRAITNNFLW